MEGQSRSRATKDMLALTAADLRDCRPLDAIDYRTGKFRQLYVRVRKIEHTAKRGMGPARELADTVKWAVLHPTAIFKGVREEGEKDWLCYASTPSHAYDYRTGDRVSGWKDEVFLVFANADGIIYNWRWEKADVNNPKIPENSTSRFDEKVMP